MNGLEVLLCVVAVLFAAVAPTAIRGRLSCLLGHGPLVDVRETGAAIENVITETYFVSFQGTCTRCGRVVSWTEGRP